MLNYIDVFDEKMKGHCFEEIFENFRFHISEYFWYLLYFITFNGHVFHEFHKNTCTSVKLILDAS